MIISDWRKFKEDLRGELEVDFPPRNRNLDETLKEVGPQGKNMLFLKKSKNFIKLNTTGRGI